MAHDDSVSDDGHGSMEEYLDSQRNRALPEPTDEQRMEAWDEASPEDHLPTIPGTAVMDTVAGETYLWDSECNRGLQYDGELMEREDGDFTEAKA